MRINKILIFSLFFLVGCIRFKYDNLSAGLVSKIPFGEKINTIEFVPVNNVITNLPVTVPVSSEYLFVVDYYKSMVKVFDYKGNLEKLISNQSSKLDDVDQIKVKFGSIGIILPGENDEVYIENKNIDKGIIEKTPETDPYASFSGSFSPNRLRNSNSVIMQIDLKQGVKNIIGKDGTDSTPFDVVEKMFLLDDNALAVLHLTDDVLTLSIFQNGKLLKTLNNDTIKPLSENESGIDTVLDTIIPHISGSYSLFSYRYYDKNKHRFKFRRIFNYNHKTGESVLLKEIQDPSEVLFAVKDDSDFYIWETESDSSSIRLQVHDKTGYHYNNKRIFLDPPRAQWRETYTDSEDNLYSLRIKSGYLEIYRWN